MMEHHSSQPESSMMSIATKIFGGLVALVIIGGVLYLVYLKSGLDPAYERQTAYDNCKATILASVASPNKVVFVNTPENTQTIPNRDGYTMQMVMQVDDHGQKTTASYNCDVAQNKSWLAQIMHDLFG
jgi:hypothetical protein